jgi:hypothetical protein
MSGINRKYQNESYRLSQKGQLCVFISHQKSDTKACSEIAEYLKSSGINVYFDEYDSDLRLAVQEDNPKKVVDAIKVGINNSTHMLCVISPYPTSKWVPFEVGYGYDSTEVMVLTLKGIKKNESPHYARAATVIRDIYDINKFVENRKGKFVLESRNFSDHNSIVHPLSNIMDSIIT